MSIRNKILLSACTLIILLLLPSARAQEGFLINEYFSSDRNWTVVSGYWKIESGEYVQSSSIAPSLSLAGDYEWNDYTAEVKLKFNEMGHIGFAFRVNNEKQNNEKQYYVTYLTSTREVETMSLLKHTGAGIPDSTLALARTPMGIKKWHILKVIAKGNSIKIYLDNILKIDKTDDSYSRGNIGLYSWGTDASFAYVRVYTGDSPPLQTIPEPEFTQKAPVLPVRTPVPSRTLPPPRPKEDVKELPYSPYDYKISTDYGPANSNWNGASGIYEITKRMGYSTVTVDSFKKAYGRKNSIMVILYPDFGIDPADLYNYVATGGNVLIADDFGYGTYVLSRFQVSFGYGTVNDEENNYEGKNFAPVVRDFKKQLAAKPVTDVVTNYPAYLVLPDNQQDMAYFSETAYVDKNFNGVKDPDEQKVSHVFAVSPVFAAALNTGRGKIIVMSDPSVFINGMLGSGDNKALFENSLSWLSGHSTAYTVYFEKRLESIPKRKISKAERKLNESGNDLTEAEKQYDSGDYSQSLGLTAKANNEIARARDSLYGMDGKERAKSEIEKSLKDFENIKQELNEPGHSEKEIAEAEQHLNTAVEKLKSAVAGYSAGDYAGSLKFSHDGEEEISKARDALYGNKSKMRGKIELTRAQSGLQKLKDELNGLKRDEAIINISRGDQFNKGNEMQSLFNLLFNIQTMTLLFMALTALFIGEKYAPDITTFFKRRGTTSRYLHSMQQVSKFDRYNEPAMIMGREFKSVFYKKIGIDYELQIKDVIKTACVKYPAINKRRLNRTLKTLEKLETENGIRFSGKNMEKLYSDINAILNEIEEAGYFEKRND